MHIYAICLFTVVYKGIGYDQGTCIIFLFKQKYKFKF